MASPFRAPEPQETEMAQTEQRRVKRNFLGEGQNVVYRKGAVVNLPYNLVKSYDDAGLTEAVRPAPSRAAAEASTAADIAGKAATKVGPAETKENPGKDEAKGRRGR